ncbi:hypothetical protein [Paenibacillus sp. 1781tsa1]|uniref:hypothetical protein n=1 Tax=Paenibacillus sp. 1781tsa1 TaxID=2953810 RepID=UPI0020A0F908|nr:hypothetical protein [Paenibacillus sp. 1781tsa1]MCP1185071.1 hypothetical protein [Paenibacillus sp. 1781tsa1]
MNNFNDAYNNDKQYKESLINSVISPDKHEAYEQAVSYTIDDLVGVLEAYKHGSITDEKEAQEQIRVFLEEYTVKLINIIKGK